MDKTTAEHGERDWLQYLLFVSMCVSAILGVYLVHAEWSSHMDAKKRNAEEEEEMMEAWERMDKKANYAAHVKNAFCAHDHLLNAVLPQFHGILSPRQAAAIEELSKVAWKWDALTHRLRTKCTVENKCGVPTMAEIHGSLEKIEIHLQELHAATLETKISPHGHARKLAKVDAILACGEIAWFAESFTRISRYAQRKPL
jgi:hypothetical protein